MLAREKKRARFSQKHHLRALHFFYREDRKRDFPGFDQKGSLFHFLLKGRDFFGLPFLPGRILWLCATGRRLFSGGMHRMENGERPLGPSKNR
jgi:hypothetical protein